MLAYRQDWYQPAESKPGQCFKRHGSAEVVTICMLLLLLGMPATRCVSKVRFLLLVKQDSSVGQSNNISTGSNPVPDQNRIAQLVEHYTVNVEEEVRRFYKNGDH